MEEKIGFSSSSRAWRLLDALCNFANSLFFKLCEAKGFPRRCLAQRQLSQLRKGTGSLESFCWSNGGRVSSAAKPRSEGRGEGRGKGASSPDTHCRSSRAWCSKLGTLAFAGGGAVLHLRTGYQHPWVLPIICQSHTFLPKPPQTLANTTGEEIHPR